LFVSTTQRSAFTRVARIVVAVLALLLAVLSAVWPFVVDPVAKATGWNTRLWWLPRNLSAHGGQVDLLFNAIFAICGVVLVGVLYYLAKFCITYRHSEVRKAHFSHGNKRLEVIWTVIPAVLLLGLALWTKGAWDNYRYSATASDPNRAQILVIGEQFRWNVVYPGPDGKLGRYMVFPQVTDAKWPALPPGDPDADFFASYKGLDGNPAPGPAYLPVEQAQKAINDYIANKNRLGKDFTDPDGLDDDWKDALSRPVYVPKGRPVEIHLTSKDVLHSFFLPDFRVKLDAVPGMRGKIYFTAAERSSAEYEKDSLRAYKLEDLENLLNVKRNVPDIRIVVPAGQESTYSGKVLVKKIKQVRERGKVVRKEVEEEEEKQIAFDRQPLTLSLIADLRRIGVKEVTAFHAKSWDLVCAELCGNGHTAMQGQLIVLEEDEYRSVRKFDKPLPTPGGSPPSSQPTAPIAGAVQP
jgi:heme/copper-type cytochrome/quinol oxidase subunit 2